MICNKRKIRTLKVLTTALLLTMTSGCRKGGEPAQELDREFEDISAQVSVLLDNHQPDRCLLLLNDFDTKTARSPHRSPVLSSRIDQLRAEVQTAKRELRAKLDTGHVIFEGRLMTPQEQSAVLEKREATARIEEEASIRHEIIRAEEKRIAQEELDREAEARWNANSVEVTKISADVVDRNNVWEKWSWEASVRNNTSSTESLTLIVKYLNSNGEILKASEKKLDPIGPGTSSVDSGLTVIDVNQSRKVSSIRAEIRRQS